MKQFDWSKPQRQPVAGLAVVFLNTFWEIIKRLWPILILMVLGNRENIDRYEILALVFLFFTIVSAVLNFIFFKFYLEEDRLVIKKGWFRKETKIIPLEKIQTVHIEQGPIHQLLNIVKLSIDTAGSQKTEASIDALNKTMAEALRQQLISGEKNLNEQDKNLFHEPVIRLTHRDLIRLSLSANHVETFFLLLSFGIGLYQNLKDINNNIFSEMQDWLPASAMYPILVLIVFVLLVTIIVSTFRIIFSFYDFRVDKTQTGFSIQSGLTNIRHRVVVLEKIQFVSWSANWIRKLMRLWMMEYHIAGGDKTKGNHKVEIPVTQPSFIPLLTAAYHHLPETNNKVKLHIDPSYVWRKTLLTGIAPSLIMIPLLWLVWEEKSLFVLVYPLLMFIIFRNIQKKFTLWAFDEIMYISKGIFGTERILLKWFKLQSVQVRQSLFQRKKNLATLVLHTAGGSIRIPYISLPAARQLADFSLFKTESSNQSWH